MHPSYKDIILRKKELDSILEKIQRMPERKSGGLYVFAGRAGIGKTTFLEQISEEFHKNSTFPLLIKQGLLEESSFVSIASAILQQILYLRPNSKLLQNLSVHQSSVAHLLLGDWALTNPSERSIENPSFTDICFVLQRILSLSGRDEDYGIIIMLDDFHLADAQIFAFFEELARYILAEHLPIYLLLGYRDSAETSSRLRELKELTTSLNDSKTSLGSKSFHADFFDLLPLGKKQVVELLDGQFNPGFSKINHQFVAWLTEQTGGNPYYLRLLVNIALERGTIAQQGTIGWTVSVHDTAGGFPKTLEDMLWEKMASLMSDHKKATALTAAAALGMRFLFSDWQLLTGIPQRDLMDILMEFEKLDLMQDEMVENAHWVFFAHPLVSETFMNNLDRDQYLFWQGRTAELMINQKNPLKALTSAVKAKWQPEKVSAVLDQALEKAFSAQDWPDIQKWYSQLSEEIKEKKHSFWLAAIEANYELGLLGESIKLRESESSHLKELSPDQRIKYYWLMHNCFLEADPTQCPPLINDGMNWTSTLTKEIREKAEKELALMQLSYLSNTAEIDKGLALGLEVREKYQEDKSFIFRIDNAIGLFYLTKGSWVKAESIYRERVVPESSKYSTTSQAKAYYNWGKVLARLGELDRAEECYLATNDLCEKNNLISIQTNLKSDLGALRWKQGKHHQAISDLEAGLRMAFASGNRGTQSVIIDILAAVKGELGETEDIVELFKQNLSLKESLKNRIGQACSMLNLAECYCRGIGCNADYNQAYGWARQALDLLNAVGSKKFVSEALINLCLASIRLGRNSEALEYAESALRHATANSAIVNIAMAQGCKGQALADVNFSEAEQCLNLAIDGFNKIGNGFEEARHLAELGRLYRKNGRHQLAIDAVNKAITLFRSLKINKSVAQLMDEFSDLLKPAFPIGSSAEQKKTWPVRILVLGKLEMIPAGSDVPLPIGAKGQLARKILAYLLTQDYNTRCGIDRKKILELFWGDVSFGGSMRVILSRLKKSLGASVTVFSANHYSFAWTNPMIYLDREQLENMWKSGLSLEKNGNLMEAWAVYEQAESLFRGKYLEDIDEPWIAPTREILNKSHRRLLQKLIDLSKQTNKRSEMHHYKSKLEML